MTRKVRLVRCTSTGISSQENCISKSRCQVEVTSNLDSGFESEVAMAEVILGTSRSHSSKQDVDGELCSDFDFATSVTFVSARK